ncbi:MAG: DUF4294 domain-containing protein [Prevotella sp.]|nr:DUF4294 domain-containing protein [Prevotella sp.]
MLSIRQLMLLLMFSALKVSAQVAEPTTAAPQPGADDPLYTSTYKVSTIMEAGDSVLALEINPKYVYPALDFKDEKQRQAYNRLVANVKKVLPLAKQANMMLLETYEYLETLPDKKSREAHLKVVEKEIFKEYKPKMKKLTISQGKLLIKLIYRECNSSTYHILKAFLGPVRAGFWQAFSSVFGASLKKEYDPDGADRLTERVVRMVEAGQL